MLKSSLQSYVFSVLLIINTLLCSCCYSYSIYEECSNSFPCGNITNITYPFRRDDQPPGCGYPGFELNCHNDDPSIKINQLKYRVLNINNDKRILQVVRDDYTNGICSLQLESTTVDPMLFEYVYGYGNITLHYGCSPSFKPFPNGEMERRQFSCNISGIANTKGYIQTGPGDSEGCPYRVVLVVRNEFLSQPDYMKSRWEEVSRKGFEVKWKVDVTACDNCKGKCGYDLSTKKTTCLFAGPLPVPHQPQPGMSSNVDWRLIIAIGFPAGMMGMIVIGVAIICTLRGRRLVGKAMVLWKKVTDPNGHDNVEELIRNYENLYPRRFPYSYIKKITNSFSDKLGEGGYGSVYKGTLQDGRLVAVKILKDSKSDGGEFMNEVSSISTTSHVNVVALLGFSYQRDKKALIYEFMPNGSLDGFIYKEGCLKRLGWKNMFQIACGIARGLEYLHRGCSTRILHFDIKPHNILLDKDLVPKISDFGLAKICPRGESIVSMMGARGTAGYIAPEVFCRNFGGASHKSDVYSYGMMVLEMVGGRKNNDMGASKTNGLIFPSLIYGQVESCEILKLEGVGSKEEDMIARKMVLVSLWCIQTMPTNRPSMSKVLEMLEASVDSLQIPPKPILASPPRSPYHSSTISVQ